MKMETLHFSVCIYTNIKVVWFRMWAPETYTQWTGEFSKGSYYETEGFSVGNKISFLTPSGHGMYSIINEIKENEMISFCHKGDIIDGKEVPQEWADAFETYKLTFHESIFNDYTMVNVEVDCTLDYVEHLKTTFPKAFDKLKSVCEKAPFL